MWLRLQKNHLRLLERNLADIRFDFLNPEPDADLFPGFGGRVRTALIESTLFRSILHFLMKVIVKLLLFCGNPFYRYHAN